MSTGGFEQAGWSPCIKSMQNPFTSAFGRPPPIADVIFGWSPKETNNNALRPTVEMLEALYTVPDFLKQSPGT